MKYELSEATAVYTQEVDTWDRGELQELKLTSIDSGASKYGASKYLVIETQRWTMDADEIQKFANFLQNWMSQHND